MIGMYNLLNLITYQHTSSLFAVNPLSDYTTQCSNSPLS